MPKSEGTKSIRKIEKISKPARKRAAMRNRCSLSLIQDFISNIPLTEKVSELRIDPDPPAGEVFYSTNSLGAASLSHVDFESSAPGWEKNLLLTAAGSGFLKEIL